MTGAQLTAARYAIGRAIGATKLSWSEMAELCGLLDPTGNGKDTIRKCAGPSGPDAVRSNSRKRDPRRPGGARLLHQLCARQAARRSVLGRVGLASA